jgi:hypothetical protein
MKRLTLDIPDELHQTIKDKAALEGKAVVDTEICKCNFTETQKIMRV